MTSFTNTFGGGIINPTEHSYRAVTLNSDVTLEWPLDNASSVNVTARIMDVTNNGAYTITMPDASLASTGESVLFNNLGPSTLTVSDARGNGLLSILPGDAWLLYLRDNSSTQGLWRSFEMGATTAQAQPATLAGYGLKADGSTLVQSMPVSNISTSPYALSIADRADVFVWTGALGTMTLPSASSAGNDWFVHVRNSGTGTLTIDPASSETINDAATLALTPGDSAVLVTDGTEWWTIGLGQNAVFAFDYTTISLNGLGPANYTLSGSELNRIVYKFTGVLAGDMVVIVPATAQQYWFENDTSGGSYTVSIKANGGATTIGIPRGERGIYYCDGSEVVKADTTAGIATPIDIADGGTGATSAATARTSLGAAALGANSDITSLSGLTTALSVAQGGTGSATAAGARTNLGSTAVGDAVFVAATAAAARSAMSAAASGINADITALNSTSGVTMGAPLTGSFPGTTGYLNAKGLYVEGVAVGVSTGTVSSVNASGGTTGLSFSGGPITSSGTLTMAGTLGVANGGTGTTGTPSSGQVPIGNGSGFSLGTITAGAGITVTNGSGTITIAASGGGSGTVTNVSGGSTGLTFSNPTTTPSMAGTLAVAYGGTGAATAAGARSALVAAGSGSNSDITLLTAISDGSAAAPSIRFANDVDTGIFRGGSDAFGLAAGGVNSLNISTTSVNALVSLRAGLTSNDAFRISTSSPPASAGASGSTGSIAWDSSYIYVCTATNTWKRAALATW